MTIDEEITEMRKDLKLPSRQELTDAMLKGTILWWELVDGNWTHYFADCRDVYYHVFMNQGRVALVKLYDRVLTFEKKEAIFRKEGDLFAQKDGRIVELKEFGS